MTQRGQRDYFEETGYNTIDPSTSSFPPATFSAYNRGSSRNCTVQRNNPPTTPAYNNPTTPSPASTQDSQQSELMELYSD